MQSMVNLSLKNHYPLVALFGFHTNDSSIVMLAKSLKPTKQYVGTKFSSPLELGSMVQLACCSFYEDLLHGIYMSLHVYTKIGLKTHTKIVSNPNEVN
jgi:hypothetical protein